MSATKTKAKSWSDAETKCIIEIYSETFADLEKMSKKKPIYEKMSLKLKDMGHVRTAGQVSKKVMYIVYS